MSGAPSLTKETPWHRVFNRTIRLKHLCHTGTPDRRRGSRTSTLAALDHLTVDGTPTSADRRCQLTTARARVQLVVVIRSRARTTPSVRRRGFPRRRATRIHVEPPRARSRRQHKAHERRHTGYLQ